MTTWMSHYKLHFCVAPIENDGDVFTGQVVSSRNRDYPVSDDVREWLVRDFVPIPAAPTLDEIVGATDRVWRATFNAVVAPLSVPAAPHETYHERVIERIESLLELERSVSAWANKQRK